MNEKFSELAKIFNIGGEFKEYSVISNGNINGTYEVTMLNNGEEKRYVFQRINVYVFKNPKDIMQNIDKITLHIARKLEEMGKSRDCVIHFAHRENGNNYYVMGEDFWRAYEYVPNTVTFNSCDDLDKLRSAGKAFGEFQTMLADFDASELFETIPNFHNTRNRIELLMLHAEEDSFGVVAEVADELSRIKAYTPLAVRLNELLDANEIPLRVTHNDTKINNVLFDKDTGEAKTVIDLDTVMPGLVAHDFGDAVRFAANTAAEDEPDLSLVSLDVAKFRAFAEGFIPEISSDLTSAELNTLALGAFTMALELSVRFLDDYITGNRYFKPHYDGHNLVRARSQLALADDIYSKLDELNSIVLELI